MSKVIIIDDNEKWIRRFKEICETIGVESFPNDPKENIKEFCKLKNLICCSMNGCKYENDIQKTLATMLNEFVAGDDDVVFIIDYQLKEGNPAINGLKFYELFAQRQPSIFVSATEDLDDIKKIQHFCNESSNCIFISKCDDDWEKILRETLGN
ncbi:MAG: hypothetical protein WCO66_00805 [Candidatus Absconditabacteria bacterium]